MIFIFWIMRPRVMELSGQPKKWQRQARVHQPNWVSTERYSWTNIFILQTLDMESELSRSASADLNLTAMLRYLDMHRTHRNLIYQLGPIRVHELNLAKQIVVPGAEVKGTRDADIGDVFDLPDVIGELQEATSLTRRTIVDILVGTHRLDEFIYNSNDFIGMVKRCITSVLSRTIITGIQYEQIAGSVYELRELRQDGLKGNDRFIDTLYKVKNRQKTDFNYNPYDSDVERRFAELLDTRDDIRLFMKLPPRFLIPTPVGGYNLDWAILKQENGRRRIYMIREIKSTPVDELLRPTEAAKIDCGRKHFETIGIDDYVKAAPED